MPRYDPEPHVLNGEQRGCHISRDGDGCIGTNGSTGQEDDDGGDNDDDDDDDASRAAASSLNDTEALDLNNKKKKRKRSKKKKSSASKQSVPPRIPLHDLFPSGQYPPGELLDYPSIAQNKLVEQRHEARRDLEESGFLNDYRKAAEIHRQVRRWVKQSVKPGQSLTELANGIEDSVRALLDNAGLEPGDSLKSGMGFPTSLSVNNCVAHYTPNPDQKDIILQQGDVTKVDFGVHTNGWIVDSAFTLAFDPTYDNLLAAVKDATNTGIKVCCPPHFTTIQDRHRMANSGDRTRESTLESATLALLSKKSWKAMRSRLAAKHTPSSQSRTCAAMISNTTASMDAK